MFLKHLINPNPSIILFFSLGCILLVFLPMLKSDLNTVFIHPTLNPFFLFISSLVIPFFLSVGLNNLIYGKNIIKKDNLVVGSVFILISNFFYNNIEVWIAGFILLFLLDFLIDSYQKDYPFSQIFNASILLSCLTLFFPNLIYLSFLFIINGINYNNFNWRVFVTFVIGLLIPYLFYFSFGYLTENYFSAPDFFNLKLINFSSIESIRLPIKIWFSILLIIITISFIELFLWLNKKSIKSRKTFITITWYFIISLFIAFFSDVSYFYFTLTPLAIIIGNYFVFSKERKVANILFTLLIISSLYYRYMISFNV